MTCPHPGTAPLGALAPALARQQYAQAPEFIQRWAEHLLWVARHVDEYPHYQLQALHVVPEGLVRPLTRPDEKAYAFLGYLLTGQSVYAQRARRCLLAVAQSVAQREKGDWTQQHTWCDAFPMARWMMLSDWLWDSEVLSQADRAGFVERMLYYTWAHPYQRLRARPIEGTPCNNQNGAMALACVVAGYLFGVKHGRDARARRMLELGLEHLLCFLTTFPRDGYSFEGSTYMGGVNAFILPLALEVASAVTGRDLFDERGGPAMASPREVFESIMRLCMPSGLMLPWDNYGFQPANFAPAAAYLARRTADAGPIQLLRQVRQLQRPAHSGWGFDGSLWTVLFSLGLTSQAWRHPAPWSFAHARQSLGAGAAGPANRLYAFQMWDRHAWPPLRRHFNPNSLVLEYDHAPLLMDGRCVENAKAAHFQAEVYQIVRGDSHKHTSFGPGSIGAHNDLFFDGEEHYVPRSVTEGELVGFDSHDGVSVFEADVTQAYAERYDVTSVRRATLVIGDELVLVRDRVQSESAHRVSWRVHLRDGRMQVDGQRAELLTADQVRLELCTPAGTVLEHRYFQTTGLETAGSGQLHDNCHELTYHVQADQVELWTMLVPSARLQPWVELPRQWQWALADDLAQAEAMADDWPGGERLDVDAGAWFYQTEKHQPGVGVYRTTFTVDALPEQALWLRVPRLVGGAVVRVNGVRMKIELGWEQEPRLDHLLEVTQAVRAGRNVIELLVPSTLEAALPGGPQLLQTAPAGEPSRLVRRDDGTLELYHGGRCERVCWQGHKCVVRRDDGRQVELSITGVSDATAAPPTGVIDCPAVVEATLANLPEAETVQILSTERLARAIGSEDWREALWALELAEGRTQALVVAGALDVLKREVGEHQTLYDRRQEDICWYRLKAAAARVLGAARCAQAVELLGELLLSEDFYPVRCACAWALGRINTAAARDYLRRVSDDDEWNTVAQARLALGLAGPAA